jgi:anti-sigma B factor antagonist
MTLSFDNRGDTDFARLPATLVLANAPVIRAALQECIAQGSARLVLDLSRVEFADSSGLSAILACVTAARRRGGDVALLSPMPRVRALVELTRLDDVVAVVDDESIAIERVHGRAAA